ncbi:hypothetical protein SIPHO063v1_p0073 [Vibrio phage PS10B.1]|nr:hypothetical protein SIPHO063v1_p0073 [Vibrio phage PS10B.1]QZI89570.1 hypothetical protein SIPHO076v1_p0037 [Vibrio phage PS34B.1]
MSSVEFTLNYSFLAASGSGPVLTAALELMWLLTGFEPALQGLPPFALPLAYSNPYLGRAT